MEQRDPNAWLQAINEAPAEEKGARCEEALKVWPAATEVWRAYVQATPSDESAQPNAGELLKRALEVSVDPKLYALYIDFVRQTNPDLLSDAYEYVLDAVSFDPDSGGLWKQYIDNLASKPALNEWEEQFRRDRVRKAYKRAVSLPLTNVENLWRSYGAFETKISRMSARKFIDERSAAYMKARSCIHAYEQVTKGIAGAGTMPSPDQSQRDAAKWRAYIQWEISNPLELDTKVEEQEQELNSRIAFAIKRANISARWAPALWFDAGSKLGVEYWIEGAQAMPESFLLAFKLAEHWEQEADYEKVRSTYKQLGEALTGCGIDPSPAWAQLVRAAHRMRGADSARDVVKACLAEVADPGISVYLAIATVECADNQLEIGNQIMAFAYTKFTSSAPMLTESGFALVQRYLHYLFRKSDVVNARSVFEQSVPKTPRHLLQKLFDHMLNMETKHSLDTGDGLISVRKLEKRYAELFQVDEAELFAKRFCDDSIFTHDLPDLAAAVAGTSNKDQAIDIKNLLPPDSILASYASSLPPADLYEGPQINVPLLMKYIQAAPDA